MSVGTLGTGYNAGVRLLFILESGDQDCQVPSASTIRDLIVVCYPLFLECYQAIIKPSIKEGVGGWGLEF